MSLILKSKYIVLFSTLLFINVTAQSNLIDSVLYVFPNKSKLCRVSGKYGVLTRKEDAQKDFHNLKWDKISESKYFPDMYLVDSSVYKGLIRKIDGKIITLPKWQFIDTFSHNVAIVVRVLENTKNIQMAMIDKNGNEIMPPTCLIKKLKNSNYLVSNEANGHLYVLDKTGKILREHLGYKAITYQNQRSTTDFMGFENQSFLTEDNNRTLWLLNADGSKDSLNYYIYSNNHSHNQSFPYILLQKKLADNEPYQSNQANRTMLIHLKTGQKYLVDRLDYNGSNKATFLKDRLTGIIADTGIALPNRYFGIRELKDGRFAAIDRDTNMILFSSNLDSLVSVSKVKDLRTISKGIRNYRLYGTS